MIKYPTGRSEESILDRVKTSFIFGFNATQQKRYIFRNRLKLYNEILKSPDKISSNIIYLMMKTFMSVDYSDEMEVEFVSREIWNSDEAENLHNLAKFDNEEMNMSEMKYWAKWNKYFYGVGIRVLNGWDTNKKCPLRSVENPLARIPDPTVMFVNNKSSTRFHGFMKEATYQDIKLSKFLDKDALDKFKDMPKYSWGEVELNKLYQQQNRGIISSPEMNGSEQSLTGFYVHYERLDDGYPYQIVTDNTFGCVLKLQKINAVGNIEKANPLEIDFPVVLNMFSPYEGDPYGVSIPDLTEDKQRARSVIMNLNKIKATREALGGLYLYDSDAVKNKADLAAPAVNGPKFIGVSGSRVQGGLSNVIMEVQQQRLNPDAINFPEVIMNEIYLSTGMDSRGLGLSQGGGITLGENQRLQANQNLKLLLDTKISGWGEKQFRTLWYRAYKEFFSSKDKKLIELNNGFQYVNTELKREHFITKNDPNIRIVSTNDKKNQDEAEKINFMALVPMVMQDPNTPEISRTFAKRKAFKLNGLSREEIDILVPPTVDELQAKSDLELLNHNESPAPIKDGQDHLTYIIIYMGARNTDAKFNAIEARKTAYIQEKQIAMQQASMMGQPMPLGGTSPEQIGGKLSNIATNQMVNGALQASSKQSGPSIG